MSFKAGGNAKPRTLTCKPAESGNHAIQRIEGRIEFLCRSAVGPHKLVGIEQWDSLRSKIRAPFLNYIYRFPSADQTSAGARHRAA